jgi:hypothetical protein
MRARTVKALVCSGLVVALGAAPVTAFQPETQRISPEAAGARFLAERLRSKPVDQRLVERRALPSLSGDAIGASARPAWAAKYLDERTGQINIVYGDDSGRIYTEQEVAARERAVEAALPALTRKADAALRSVTERLGPVERVQVGIWLDADTSGAVAAVKRRYPTVEWLGDRPVTSDAALSEKVAAELYRAREQAYAAVQARASAAIQHAGGRPGYRSSSVPLVFADLPNTALKGLAARADVVGLALDGDSWTPQMQYAGGTVQADWAAGEYDQGTGIRAAVIEYYNVRPTGDLYGKVVASHSVDGRIQYSPGFDHPTWVAGAIVSRDSVDRGVAPGALIVSSATGGGARGELRDEDVIRATDWAIHPDKGKAKVVNVSLGQDTARGVAQARGYFDAIASEAGRLTVAAAGNYGTAYLGNYYVVSPGTGWNVLAVGGIDDRNTRSWSGDRIWYHPSSDPPTGSNYRERLSAGYNSHGDFNKPDVSAPAYRVRTANGISASGTSVATPIVTGIVAQLLARRAVLHNVPEAVRAIIMASAVHRTPMPNGAIDRNHEGVGTVTALWAHRVMWRGNGPHGGYDFGLVSRPKSTGTETAKPNPVVRTFTATQGQRLRVALTWGSETSGPSVDKTDRLTADLDFHVTMPDGKTRRLAHSYDNSHEFTEFIAPASGTYKVTIVAPRFDTNAIIWALAWAKV